MTFIVEKFISTFARLNFQSLISYGHEGFTRCHRKVVLVDKSSKCHQHHRSKDNPPNPEENDKPNSVILNLWIMTPLSNLCLQKYLHYDS